MVYLLKMVIFHSYSTLNTQMVNAHNCMIKCAYAEIYVFTRTKNRKHMKGPSWHILKKGNPKISSTWLLMAQIKAVFFTSFHLSPIKKASIWSRDKWEHPTIWGPTKHVFLTSWGRWSSKRACLKIWYHQTWWLKNVETLVLPLQVATTWGLKPNKGTLRF